MRLGDTTTREVTKDLGRLYADDHTADRLVSMLGEELFDVELSPAAITLLWALNFKVGPLSGPSKEDLERFSKY